MPAFAFITALRHRLCSPTSRLHAARQLRDVHSSPTFSREPGLQPWAVLSSHHTVTPAKVQMWSQHKFPWQQGQAEGVRCHPRTPHLMGKWRAIVFYYYYFHLVNILSKFKALCQETEWHENAISKVRNSKQKHRHLCKCTVHVHTHIQATLSVTHVD